MHHLADPLQGKRLQPHHGHVPFMFEGEVLDHVRPSHRQPQPQERDLLKLQTQKGKVAGQDLSLYFVFFHSGTEVVPLFWHFGPLLLSLMIWLRPMKQFVGK